LQFYGQQIKKARVFQPGPLGCEGEPQLYVKKISLDFTKNASDQGRVIEQTSLFAATEETLWLVEPLFSTGREFHVVPTDREKAHASCKVLPWSNIPVGSYREVIIKSVVAASMLHAFNGCDFLSCLYLLQRLCQRLKNRLKEAIAPSVLR
jgi:hypothetical protein